MRRLASSFLALLFLTAAAQAQFLPKTGVGTGFGTGPGTMPGSPLSGGIGSSAPGGGTGFSPYLNLLRGGSSAVNYYGLVRPQQNFQSALQQVQQQQQAGGANFEPDDPTMPGLVVGTRTRFLNTSGYFLNLQGGTTMGAGGGFASGMGSRAGAGGQGNQGVSGQGTGTGFSTGFGIGGFGTSPGGNRGPTRGPR